MNSIELINILTAEWFPVVYERHDEPGVIYEKHCHKDKVSFYVIQWDVTFTFEDWTTKIVSSWERIDVPVKIYHTALVWPSWCDYVVGQMNEDDA